MACARSAPAGVSEDCTLRNKVMILMTLMRARPGNCATDRAGQPGFARPRRQRPATARAQLPALNQRRGLRQA